MTAEPLTRPWTPLADPRVEELVRWVLGADDARAEPEAALEALEGQPPRPETAGALAAVVRAAYGSGPRRRSTRVAFANRVVALLARLGDPGFHALSHLRVAVADRRVIVAVEKALARMPAPIDASAPDIRFSLDPQVGLDVPVGSFVARLGLGEDLRRVRTTWRTADGRPRARRPAATAGHPEDLERLELERRQLQSDVTALRAEAERLMMTQAEADVDSWAATWFGDPLRAAFARRLVWSLRSARGEKLVLPHADGVQDVTGAPAAVHVADVVRLWHPAGTPSQQAPWTARLAALSIRQPVDQVERDVVLAEGPSPIDPGLWLEQPPVRAFLRARGWRVPRLGRYYAVPEATKELWPGGPAAVLHLDWREEDGRISFDRLEFTTAGGADLEARELPAATVSEAGRDALGAAHAGRGIRS